MEKNTWQKEIRLQLEREKKARRILEVSDSADWEEIKRAWRKKALKYHPDREETTDEPHQEFLLAQSAYMYLTGGEHGEDLDNEPSADTEITDGKYRLDNTWGYFLWWKERFFD